MREAWSKVSAGIWGEELIQIEREVWNEVFWKMIQRWWGEQIVGEMRLNRGLISK